MAAVEDRKRGLNVQTRLDVGFLEAVLYQPGRDTRSRGEFGERRVLLQEPVEFVARDVRLQVPVLRIPLLSAVDRSQARQGKQDVARDAQYGMGLGHGDAVRLPSVCSMAVSPPPSIIDGLGILPNVRKCTSGEV